MLADRRSLRFFEPFRGEEERNGDRKSNEDTIVGEEGHIIGEVGKHVFAETRVLGICCKTEFTATCGGQSPRGCDLPIPLLDAGQSRITYNCPCASLRDNLQLSFPSLCSSLHSQIASSGRWNHRWSWHTNRQQTKVRAIIGLIEELSTRCKTADPDRAIKQEVNVADACAKARGASDSRSASSAGWSGRAIV